MGKPEVDQAHIFEQYTNFLRAFAAEQPLLLVFDDLHWADASSLSLLFHLSRRIDQSRIMIIGTYRPEETGVAQVGTESPLGKLLSELKRYWGDITIAVDQEDEATTRAFVDACVDVEPNRLGFDFRAALRRHTAGNPLFITEILHHLRESKLLVKDAQGEWDQVGTGRLGGAASARGRSDRGASSAPGKGWPGDAVACQRGRRKLHGRNRGSAAIGRRSRYGPPAERRDEQTASPGRGFGCAAAGQQTPLALPVPPQSLSEVSLRQPGQDRADLHEDIGNALESFYADRLDDVAVELAWHFSCAGVEERAAHYHRRAGELAVSRYAHKEAIDHFTSALALTPETDTTARCELLLARETVYDWLGLRDAAGA